MTQWSRQREIYLAEDGDDLILGFATLFLNRTNRSGILQGRPIGGMKQDGAWRLDARFPKDGLCERIRLIGSWRDRIEVTQLDAEDFFSGLESAANVLAYVDPPYLKQSDKLYYVKFPESAHIRLAEVLAAAEYRWVLTYDANDRITDELYRGKDCAEFGITHSAQVRHEDTEYMVFGPNLVRPDLRLTRSGEATLVSRQSSLSA